MTLEREALELMQDPKRCPVCLCSANFNQGGWATINANWFLCANCGVLYK